MRPCLLIALALSVALHLALSLWPVELDPDARDSAAAGYDHRVAAASGRRRAAAEATTQAATQESGGPAGARERTGARTGCSERGARSDRSHARSDRRRAGAARRPGRRRHRSRRRGACRAVGQDAAAARRSRLQGVSRAPADSCSAMRRIGSSMREISTRSRPSASCAALPRCCTRGRAASKVTASITAAGLLPYEFSFERGSKDRREVASFDWEAGIVTLNDDKTVALEIPTFDWLAIMWQYYFSPPSGNEVSFSVATTRRVARYTIEREDDEKIDVGPGRDRHGALAPPHRRRQDRRLRLARAVAPFHSREDSLHRPAGHVRGAARLDPRRREDRAAMMQP